MLFNEHIIDGCVRYSRQTGVYQCETTGVFNGVLKSNEYSINWEHHTDKLGADPRGLQYGEHQRLS